MSFSHYFDYKKMEDKVQRYLDKRMQKMNQDIFVRDILVQYPYENSFGEHQCEGAGPSDNAYLKEFKMCNPNEKNVSVVTENEINRLIGHIALLARIANAYHEKFNYHNKINHITR